MRFLDLWQVDKSEPSLPSSSLDLYGKFKSLGGLKMPVNVRRFYTSFLLTVFAFTVFASGQAAPQNTPPDTQPAAQTIPAKAPTSAEIMRDRISKAKAFIAVRNYNAAIYELENIRRESSDQSVQAVSTVLLMNSYLEQGDYKRAQDFLTETYNAQKANRPNAAEIYTAIAGQVVKGARNKVERYRTLGLMVSDRNLPLEAVTDVERMRETLELVITQAKENGKDRLKAPTAMALLEEATSSRSALARDDYDARRWKDEVADSREQLSNSRSIIVNAVDGAVSPAAVIETGSKGMVPETRMAANQPNSSQPVVMTPAPERVIASANDPKNSVVPSGQFAASAEPPKNPDPVKRDEPAKPIIVQNQSKEDSETAKQSPRATDAAPIVTPPVKEAGPLEVGSLIAYATRQSSPVYPPAARTMRTIGVVKVEVTVDETGEVAEIQKTTGPMLLQAAAKDAVMKWRFRPFIRDGQPVRATGFVNFNFSL